MTAVAGIQRQVRGHVAGGEVAAQHGGHEKPEPVLQDGTDGQKLFLAVCVWAMVPKVPGVVQAAAPPTGACLCHGNDLFQGDDGHQSGDVQRVELDG
jgi:hypothetical protein